MDFENLYFKEISTRIHFTQYVLWKVLINSLHSNVSYDIHRKEKCWITYIYIYIHQQCAESVWSTKVSDDFMKGKNVNWYQAKLFQFRRSIFSSVLFSIIDINRDFCRFYLRSKISKYNVQRETRKNGFGLVKIWYFHYPLHIKT